MDGEIDPSIFVGKVSKTCQQKRSTWKKLARQVVDGKEFDLSTE